MSAAHQPEPVAATLEVPAVVAIDVADVPRAVWHRLSAQSTTLIQTATGIRWELWADIYFNAQFDFDYETDPARGAENEDIR